ncbi:MAG: ankyrin repeat domain-containing protein [Pseudomonadota bacterium]|nr:ankyrin repeat domain-containing protein [Pseudomonadota bacterium]
MGLHFDVLHVKIRELNNGNHNKMYIHINNTDAFIMVKVIGGTIGANPEEKAVNIATDNTCKTLTELNIFFQDVISEIIKYNNFIKEQYQIHKIIGCELENKAEQISISKKLNRYESIISIMKRYFEKHNFSMADYTSMPIQELLSSGVHAIVLDSQTNRDNYLKSTKPIFSVPHEVYDLNNYDNSKNSILGSTLRKKFNNINLIKKASFVALKNSFIQKQELSSELKNIEILEILRESWLAAKLDVNKWVLISPTFEARINQIRELESGTFIFDKNQIINVVDDDIWQTLFVDDNTRTCDIIITTKLHSATVIADKISTYSQFILAMISVYLKDHFNIFLNLGEIFENDIKLCQNLAEIIHNAIINDYEIELEVIKFVEQNKLISLNTKSNNTMIETESGSEFKLDAKDYENITKKIKLEYRAIMSSDHFDEFFICPEDTASKWFSYGGAICCELTHLIQVFMEYIPSLKNKVTQEYTDFINEQSVKFKQLTRNQNNSITFKDNSKLITVESYLNKAKENHELLLRDDKFLKFCLKNIQHDTKGIISLLHELPNRIIAESDGLLLITGLDKRVYQTLIPHIKDLNYTRYALQLTYFENSVLKDDFVLAEELLKNGVDINYSGASKRTPLELAAQELIKNGNTRPLNFLIKNGVDLNKIFTSGTCLIHHICTSPELIKLLVDNNADINKPNYLGETVLHIMISIRNQLPMYENEQIKNNVIFMINNGADINIKDNYGKNPVQLAIQFDNISLARELIRRGANIFAGNVTNCLDFLSSDDLNLRNELIELFCKHNYENNYENFPLHSACRLHQYDIINSLLKHGVNVNTYDSGGNTPIKLLLNSYDKIDVEARLVTIIEQLLKFGASPNSITTKNINNASLAKIKETIKYDDSQLTKYSSPLQISIIKQQSEIAILLLEYGADINFCSADGYNALCFAIMQANIELVDLLLENGAEIIPRISKKTGKVKAVNPFKIIQDEIDISTDKVRNKVLNSIKCKLELKLKKNAPTLLQRINKHKNEIIKKTLTLLTAGLIFLLLSKSPISAITISICCILAIAIVIKETIKFNPLDINNYQEYEDKNIFNIKNQAKNMLQHSPHLEIKNSPKSLNRL